MGVAWEKLALSNIKLNPNNPRIIKDDKFDKLVESIKSFPEMLELRPIVINDDNVVLGGNMRLRACREAGLKNVPVIKASDLTEDQQREFIIKDNVGFGEWDFQMLANEWNVVELAEWALDVPKIAGNEDPDDLSGNITTEYKIEVVCKSEAEQEKVYNSLIEKGLECRLLTL